MKTLDPSGLAGPIVRVLIGDPTSTTGAGKTGLTNASAGLNVAIIADNGATSTAYTSAGATVQSIATLGAWAAPSANNCRFKEVDSTNHPGLYELQFAAALWATAGAKKLVGTVLVTGGTPISFEIQLTGYDFAGGAVGAATLLDAVQVEPGINARQALAPMLAALAGVLSGAGTGTITIKQAGGATTRITATTDASGNRSVVVLSLPA